MRCLCCNRALNDYESTLRSVSTEQYTDMCTKCLSQSGIATVGRQDLNPYDEVHDDDFTSYTEEDTDAQDCTEWEDE